MSKNSAMAVLLRGDVILMDSNFVSFRDTVFRLPTVVFPDGATAMVEQSVVAVSDPEHMSFLAGHAHFERVDRSAWACTH
jgi:hypothetical protein